MKSEPGSYALVLHNRSEAKAQIGRWKEIRFRPGYYIYVGSAFGPGGVYARVSRHCRRAKASRWHIDYLGSFMKPIGAFYSHQPDRLEHRWAQALKALKGMTAIGGFGCSDCHCEAHLFRTDRAPDAAPFARIAGSRVESWWYRCPADI